MRAKKTAPNGAAESCRVGKDQPRMASGLRTALTRAAISAMGGTTFNGGALKRGRFH